MKLRPFLLSAIFLAAYPLLARDQTDVVILKNGDHITGEVKSLADGVLSVSLDYVDGNISVDWSKVARLESHQLFVVITEDGSSYQASLATVEGAAGEPILIRLIETTGTKVEVDRYKVVRIDETSEKFLQRFNGAVNLGLNYTKGNNATQYNLGTDVQYLRERWMAEANYNSSLSSNSGSATSIRNQLDLRSYHLLRWNNYFYGGLASFLQSSVQEINLQTTIGGGIGHFFTNTNRTSIAVLGGLGWVGTNYNSSANLQGTQNVATALIAGQARLFKFKKTNLDAYAVLLPALSDPGRVRFNTNVTYYLKLFGNLSWNASFYGNWDSRPPDDFPGSDYGASSGVSWTFGNR